MLTKFSSDNNGFEIEAKSARIVNDLRYSYFVHFRENDITRQARPLNNFKFGSDAGRTSFWQSRLAAFHGNNHAGLPQNHSLQLGEP